MAKRVTISDVINHMQVHAMEFRKEFRKVHKRIDDLENKLTNRMDGLEQRLSSEIRGVDDLDFRVQDLENENLPKRVNRLEKKLALKP